MQQNTPRSLTTWLAIGLAGMVGSPAISQVLPDESPLLVPQTSPSLIAFEDSQVDFGKIGDEAKVEHQFNFKNNGKGALVIRSARGSCGCTVPTLAKNTFAPGESGTIEVFFNPHNRRGPQNQTVTVQTNDPKNPVVRLGVHAFVQPRTMVNPRSLSYGFVTKGSGPTMDIKVAGIEDDFDVTKAWVELTPLPDTMKDMIPTWEPEKVFHVEMGDRSERVIDGRTYYERVVHVTMAKDAPLGLLRNVRLIIEHNDKPTKRFEIPVLATQLGDVTMTPQRLSFGRVVPGAAFEKEVIVRSSTNTPFKISNIEHLTTSGQGIDYELVPIESSNGSAYKLFLRSSGLDRQGAIRGQLRLHTDVKGEEIITYNYVGAVMPTRTSPNLVPTTPPATTARPATAPAGPKITTKKTEKE